MYWRTLFLLAAAGAASAYEKPCTIHHGGKFYDLNSLKATRYVYWSWQVCICVFSRLELLLSSSEDYEFRTPGDHLFAMNICRSPVRETFGLNDVDSPDIGGFVRRDHGDFSIG